jgi:two-component system cell cycle response regulator DivK
VIGSRLDMIDDKPVAEPRHAQILIVEDNLFNYRLMARLLALRGIENCEWMVSGAQVAEPAGSPGALRDFDLILMDIYLPREDGYQLLARLRRNPSFARTPIVAVTADATPDNLRRAREAGFDGFIGKPINSARFPDQVGKLLRGEPVWELD